ncbi:hypothetical protein [Kribbella sp. NPDC051137]|uniref:hypothetical protein n=1 Tax=Kribbella sp. NPDC051137 TaxID=3155045 RepID=UPI00342E85BF
MKIQKTYATLATHAVCSRCDRTWRGRNALAVGAQHARIHGHEVRAVWTTCAVYDPAPRSRKGTS